MMDGVWMVLVVMGANVLSGLYCLNLYIQHLFDRKL
jgi:hypothetical protein